MKPNRNNKNRYKKKGGKGYTEKTVAFTSVMGLFDKVETNRNNFYLKVDDIYKIFEEEYEKDEFISDAELIFETLRTPIQLALWTLYPAKYLNSLKINENDNFIIEGMQIFSQLAEDQEDIYSFIFPEEEFPEIIYPALSSYKREASSIMKSVEKKMSNNIEDLINLSDKFIDELYNMIISEWDELELNDEQLLAFYTIAIYLFRDIILYQREVEVEKIDTLLNNIKTLAENEKYHRVLDLIDSY